MGTNFQLLGYRYSTSGFYNLDETTYTHMQGYTGDAEQDDANEATNWLDYYNLNWTKRGKLQFNISQQLGGLGSLFVTGSQQRVDIEALDFRAVDDQIRYLYQ